MTCHRQRDRALAVVDEIENGGGEAVATQLDLASTGSVSHAVGTALEGWGQVDQRASRRVVPAACSGRDLTLAGYAILFGFLAARCFRWGDDDDLHNIRPAPPTVTEAGTSRRDLREGSCRCQPSRSPEQT